MRALSCLILTLLMGSVPAAAAPHPWWQSAVIYQIYPRSFQDSDGDGVGDLKGIISRVGYLKELGVDAVWLSPVYPSPMKDFGYDITDYQGVDPRFGTLADLTQLIQTLHANGIKLVMDLVANHTSNEHPWFIEARSSKKNPKRDWYVWRDPAKGGGPPNNWRSVFAGEAWTLDPTTKQYYYHAFLPEQPDLNWHNPAVRAAMTQAMRFWLDRGVDGFRIDAIGQLVEDAQFRDEKPNPAATAASPDYQRFIHDYTTEQADTHTYLRMMRQVAASYSGDRVLISEDYLPIAQMLRYYGKPGALEAQLPFNFHLIGAPWTARATADYAAAYDAALPAYAWPNWVLGNHDRSRLATRLGPEQARLAALLLLTLRGTPTLYYGDELGMTDVPLPAELVQDPEEKRDPGKGVGRDPERTPMPWNGDAQAGFTTGTPWLPLGPDVGMRNVAAQSKDPTSLLRLYQSILALRRQHPALALGTFRNVAVTDTVFVYARKGGAESFLIALNFSDQPQPLPELPAARRLLLTTAGAVGTEAVKNLKPHEGVVFQL